MRPGIFGGVAARLVLGAVAVATASTTPPAGPPCLTKDFQTEMVKAACAAGGQDEAKRQMTLFVAKHAEKGQKLTKKLFTCNACHAMIDPTFERKPGALDLYRQLGGK